MVATMNPPPVKRSDPVPVKPRKVPIVVKPSAEELAQNRRDRLSVAAVALMITGLVALLVWAIMGADPPNTDMMWQYPDLY